MILIDTYTLVWMVSDPEKLSPVASARCQRPNFGSGVAVSAITLGELAWLAKKGRVTITGIVKAFAETATMRTAMRLITVELPCRRPSCPAHVPLICATETLVRPHFHRGWRWKLVL